MLKGVAASFALDSSGYGTHEVRLEECKLAQRVALAQRVPLAQEE